MTDVVVLGGGMAGAIAALSARRRGKTALLIRRSLGATALSSGAIDVAPDPVAPGGDLKSHLIAVDRAASEVARAKPNHPYAILRSDLPRLPEALAFAQSALGELLGPMGERNRLLPTPLGTVKPTALAQKAQLGADVASLPEKVAVLQLRTYAMYDARLLAGGIREAASSLGRKVDAVVVTADPLKLIEDALRPPIELAERFDAPGVIEALGDELKRLLPEGVGAVLCPPLLGRTRRDALAVLSARVGVPCAEILSAAPSVPGVRLQETLDAALTRAGVEIREAEVRAAGQGLSLLVAGAPLSPRAVVLATGKFIGGGIDKSERFRETVFGLPVYAGNRRVVDQFIGDLLSDELRGDQAAFRAGVRIDPLGRPLNGDATVFHEKLYAAGAVVSGYDPAQDKTGLGVAIFTGFLAGERAAE